MTAYASKKLARAATQTRWSDLPVSVQGQAKDLFVDTVAVSSAGLCHPSYAPLVEALCTEPGCATVPGLPQGVPINTAVQINGGATTVLQLQDGHRMGRGHPASHMVPALLALAEETNVNADAVLSALVAGYEIGARIGIAMDGLNPLLHDTGTWSAIGTAVAAAHLLSGAEATVIAAAIESSAATALMPYRELPVQGASAHHLYIGLGATSGVMAARGAVAGMAPLPGTLETFFGPRAGAAFNAGLLGAGLDETEHWSRFEIERAYFKVHPTCAHLHGANDAILSLINTHGFGADDVGKIEVATYAAGLSFDNPTPVNAFAARFSISATVAVAVCCRALDETTLTDENLKSAAVQALIKRIHVVHDSALDAGYPDGRPACVTLSLNDGTTISERVQFPRGDHTNPIDRGSLRAKARRLLSIRFADRDANAVLDALDSYLDGGPIGDVSTAMRTPSRTV